MTSLRCHSKTLSDSFAFSWLCAILEQFIYRKGPFLEHTKPGRGWEMLGLHSVSPCCFLRNMCDLKDKVVTEGKGEIFNESPQAHGHSRSFISQYQYKLLRHAQLDSSQTPINNLRQCIFACFSFFGTENTSYLGSEGRFFTRNRPADILYSSQWTKSICTSLS